MPPYPEKYTARDRDTALVNADPSKPGEADSIDTKNAPKQKKGFGSNTAKIVGIVSFFTIALVVGIIFIIANSGKNGEYLLGLKITVYEDKIRRRDTRIFLHFHAEHELNRRIQIKWDRKTLKVVVGQFDHQPLFVFFVS